MNTEAFRRLTAEAVAMAEAVEAREQELAAAAEQLSQEAAVQMAFRDGAQHERDRMVRLIDMQQAQLSRGGINALALTALRRQVLGVER